MLSCVQLFAALWTSARQASLSVTNSQSLLKLMSIELVMSSNHLILCRPPLLPSIFPSIRVFSNELALRIRWPKCWRRERENKAESQLGAACGAGGSCPESCVIQPLPRSWGAGGVGGVLYASPSPMKRDWLMARRAGTFPKPVSPEALKASLRHSVLTEPSEASG